MPLTFDAPPASGQQSTTSTATVASDDPLADLFGDAPPTPPAETAVTVADEADADYDDEVIDEEGEDASQGEVAVPAEDRGTETLRIACEKGREKAHAVYCVLDSEKTRIQFWTSRTQSDGWTFGYEWTDSVGSCQSPAYLRHNEHETEADAIGAALGLIAHDFSGRDLRVVTVIDEWRWQRLQTVKAADELLRDVIAGGIATKEEIAAEAASLASEATSPPVVTTRDISRDDQYRLARRRLEELLAEQSIAVNEAKSRAKSLEAYRKDLVDQLQELRRDYESGKELESGEAKEKPASDDQDGLKEFTAAANAVGNATADAAAASSWRDCRFDDTTHFPKFAKGIIASLAEAGIETVGQFADRNSDLSNVKGIGKAKQEKLADAMEAFWKKHPEAKE